MDSEGGAAIANGHASLEKLQVGHGQQNPLHAVQQRRAEYKQWLREYVKLQAGIPADQEVDQGTLQALAPYADVNLQDMASSLYKASAAYSYLYYLKYWAETVRELERKTRELGLLDVTSTPTGPALSLQADQQQYTAAVHATIQALGAAMYAGEMAAYYASAAWETPALAEAATTIDNHMQQCRHQLYTRLCEDVRTQAEAWSWPPPLVHATQADSPPGSSDNNAMPVEGPEGGIRKEGIAATGEDSDGENNQSASLPQSASSAGAFQGFAAAGGSDSEAKLTQLLAAISSLTTLQQTVDKAGFAAPEQPDSDTNKNDSNKKPAKELPLLWAAQVLAGPLQAKLQAHFQPHTAAGRLDQPSWLPKIILQLIQDYKDHMAVLQPALEVCGLTGRCHMRLEWIRAMRDTAKAVIRTTRLPALVELWEDKPDADTCALWAAHLASMIELEQKIVPFMGAIDVKLGHLPQYMKADSVLGAITGDPHFMATWLAVLQHTATTQMEEAQEELDAWQAAPADEEDDVAVDDLLPPELAELAAVKEFKPPRIAESVLKIVSKLVDLAELLPTAEAQRDVLEDVAGTVLNRAHQMLSKALEQAATYRGLASEDGAPWSGACVAAARYLHFHVSEMLASTALDRLNTEEQLLTYKGLSPKAASGEDSPSDSVMEVAIVAGWAPVARNLPVLVDAVGELGTSYRDWCLRIAKELAFRFSKAAAPYQAVARGEAPYPIHAGAAGTVSPELLPALQVLQTGLTCLEAALDYPSFTDIWRAVVMSVNRFLFNCIATEARFTRAGAQQFQVDVMGMVSVFLPCTKRATAHFKETLAAVRLLNLDDDVVQEVVRHVSAVSVQAQPLHVDPWLKQLGCGWLLPDQVLAVVEGRM